MGLLDDVFEGGFEPPPDPQKARKQRALSDAATRAAQPANPKREGTFTRAGEVARELGLDTAEAKRERIFNPTAEGVRIGQQWKLHDEKRAWPAGRWTVSDVLTDPRRVALMSNDTGARKTLPLDKFLEDYERG
jgi:hypothetical protein